MYTEAVVRSSRERTDFHVGVVARPGSLSGYSLNLPLPGGQAGGGVGRLRWAQNPVDDDPLFPSLIDGTLAIDPVASPASYLLGRGILRTAHAAAFPPPVADVFDPDVTSEPVGSVQDVPGVALGFANTETLLGSLWEAGVAYTDGTGQHSVAPAIQDRPLTDGTTLAATRYYRWRIPFAATSFTLGTGLPLGRLVLDLRLLDSAGKVVFAGASQRLLQSGTNVLTLTGFDPGQGLANNIELPLGGSGSSGATFSAIRTLAGAAGMPGMADGVGSAARFDGPAGVAVDGAGHVYVADMANSRIRKIMPDGTVGPWAGSGSPVEADGAAATAGFAAPAAIVRDGAGNLYVADSQGPTIRKITPGGVVTTIAGIPGIFGHSDGPGAIATFTEPSGLALDSSGNLFVADGSGNVIRKIDALGVVSTLAGSGTAGYADGAATTAAFDGPSGLAIDPAGNVYVADAGNHRIRKVTPGGTVSTLAGTGVPGYGDGAALSALFADPVALVWAPPGILYVSDSGNSVIRKLDLATSQVSTVAGLAGQAGHQDGPIATAKMDSPWGLALDGSGHLIVADLVDHTVRVIE